MNWSFIIVCCYLFAVVYRIVQFIIFLMLFCHLNVMCVCLFVLPDPIIIRKTCERRRIIKSENILIHLSNVRISFKNRQPALATWSPQKTKNIYKHIFRPINVLLLFNARKSGMIIFASLAPPSNRPIMWQASDRRIAIADTFQVNSFIIRYFFSFRSIICSFTA